MLESNTPNVEVLQILNCKSRFEFCIESLKSRLYVHKSPPLYGLEGPVGVELLLHAKLDPGSPSGAGLSTKAYCTPVLSVTSLNAKFKEVTGTTFNDYLNRYRIQKSIKLIKEGKYHYYQVAEMVGFKDYKYFNHVFNKYIKMSVKKFEQLVLKSEKN